MTVLGSTYKLAVAFELCVLGQTIYVGSEIAFVP